MATLADLPVELIERVATLLTTQEIGKLRLVSRELRAKASQGSFLNNFIHHKTDLCEVSLTALISALSNDGLARRLRHLTLTTLVYDDHNELAPTSSLSPDWDPPLLSRAPKSFCNSEVKGQNDLREVKEERQRQAKIVFRRAQHELNVECEVYPAMVQQAFQLIKRHCPGGCLESLRLGCRVYVGIGARLELADTDAQLNNLPAHTSFLFSIAMDALLASKLSIHSLDIFSRMRHCSLACTQLSPYMACTSMPDLRAMAKSVTSLALSFSRLTPLEAQRTRDMCCNCNARAARRSNDKITCHKHLALFEEEDDIYCQCESSLASFLKLFTNLEDLDLHQYEIERAGDKWNPVAFEQVAHHSHLENLKALTLRGVNAHERCVLDFILIHKNLHSLDIRHVNLRDGQWQSIFSHIKRSMPHLRMLNLEDLFENKRADLVMVPLPPAQQSGVHNAPLQAPFGGIAPPVPTTEAETYLNTLVSFRVVGVPDENFTTSGQFRSNKVRIAEPWIIKADIMYGFVSHAATAWKVEKRWMLEQGREYGPPPEDLFATDV